MRTVSSVAELRTQVEAWRRDVFGGAVNIASRICGMLPARIPREFAVVLTMSCWTATSVPGFLS